MIIKVLLIVGIALAVVYAIRAPGSNTNVALRRVAGALFALVAAVSVIFPDAVTWMANLVGVAEGTNLVLYALVIAFLFVSIALYQRVHDLERKLTELTRRLALLGAAQWIDRAAQGAPDEAPLRSRE